MSDHFDRSETRPWKTREAAMFRDFKAIVSLTKAHAPTVRAQTRGVDISKIKHLNDLVNIPVTRYAQRTRLCADAAPYGGYLASRPGSMQQLFLNAAAGHSRDWWSAARALHAAGFVKSDIILNCASYHFSTSGHMIDGAARECGCASIPAGPDSGELQLEALRLIRPNAYCGKPGVLRRLLERAAVGNYDLATLKKALVFGAPLSTHFRKDAEARGVRVRQAYTTPEAGVIAYETSRPDGCLNEGMIVNEGLIVEIVKPGTDTHVKPGEIGEVVISRLNADFPLLRLSTGDLSRVIPGPSPCGRTNLRIQGWMGRVEETARFQDKTVYPSQILEMGARHACVRKMQLVFSNAGNRDDSVLRVEGPNDDPQFPINLNSTMRNVLGFEARIDIVAPGALRNDRKLIFDQRARD